MGGNDSSRNWLLDSMSLGMRRTAGILCAITLSVTLVFAGLLYAVGTTPLPTVAQQGVVATSTASGHSQSTVPATGTTAEDVESISDDAVPLAAPQQRTQGAPTYLLLGFGLGFAVIYFVAHIHRVNVSISSMSKGSRRL